MNSSGCCKLKWKLTPCNLDVFLTSYECVFNWSNGCPTLFCVLYIMPMNTFVLLTSNIRVTKFYPDTQRQLITCGFFDSSQVTICSIYDSIVVYGSGPGRTHPHNHCYLRHCSRKQPWLSWTAAVESNSSILFKHLLHSCLKLGSSRQMQGVIVAALSRRLELRVQCAASASCSSAEAASSVLSTSSESWIACVGRANSST